MVDVGSGRVFLAPRPSLLISASLLMSAPKLLTHCPLCSAQYEECSIKLLGESGTTRTFHLTCQACSHAVLAVILENQHGVSSLGMVTDLEVQDAVRFQDSEPISADDCLNAKDLLANSSREFVLAIAESGTRPQVTTQLK